MKFLAPIVITLLVSGGLYMNREIWSLANYKQSGTQGPDLSGYSEPGMQQYRARGTKYEEGGQFVLGSEQYKAKQAGGGTQAAPQDLRSESR